MARGRPLGTEPANRIRFRLDPETARMLRELTTRGSGTMTTEELLTWLIHRAHRDMTEADVLYPDRVGGPGRS